MRSTTMLRKALDQGEQIVAPGIYDPLSAKAVADLGFRGLSLSGFASSATLATMEPVMTMTEQVELARRVADVVDIPLVVDGHTGFGDAVHITRAVREFERAQVAAIHLEDEVFPKQVGYYKGRKHVVSIEAMQHRIAVACEARQDNDFVIIARSDAASAGASPDEVLERLAMYSEAGADVIMTLVSSLEEAKQVREAIPDKPLLWTAGLRHLDGDEVHVDVLKELGFQIVIYPLVGLVSAIDAVVTVYEALMKNGVVDVADFNAGYQRIMELGGSTFFSEIEERDPERVARGS